MCRTNIIRENDACVCVDRAKEQVFSVAGLPLVKYALDGYNGAIITYGQTASGKVHTVLV